MGQSTFLEGKDVKTADRARPDIFHDILGPPMVETLASIIAGRTKADFINFSAVTSGIKASRSHEQAEESRCMGIRTVLFVDEIHRFNKAQQMPSSICEKGIVLIGATRESSLK